MGIGGAGANVLDRMALDGVAPDSLVAANTEAQALVASVAGEKIQLGQAATRGLGAGGDPELGRCAAEEAAAEIRAAVEGVESVFIIAGLGGGTGSGAAPLVAELAREAGALVIAVVTLPFGFEGKRRAAQAAEALAELQQHADAVVCFENDRMGEAVPPRAGIQSAFTAADQTISQSVLALAALLNRTGLIHLGFDELTAVLRDVNARCLFGYGEAEGSNRSFDALARAFKNPLMDKGRMLRDCETVLVQVSGGHDLTLDEVQLLMEEFNRSVGERTRILFGAAVDPELAGRVTVTILSSVADGTAAVARTPLAQPERIAPAVAPARSSQPVAATRVAPEGALVRRTEPEQDEEAIAPAAEIEWETESKIPVVQEPEPVEVEVESAEAAEAAEAFALDADAPLADAEAEEEPVVEPAQPEPPRVEKPRGLRAATQQASLFGDEPAVPVERIAPPVPGRMLRRPFPERPAPAPVPETASEPVDVADQSQPPPVTETASEPEEPQSPAQPEPEVQEAPSVPSVPSVVSVPSSHDTAAPEPSPQPKTERKPLITRRPVPQPLRSPELIPAEELALASGPVSKAPLQEVMQFEPVTRGRFEKSEPTIVDGQDLDVPTYLRRRVKLR